MSFVNNLRVAYKLLILCVIGVIGMAILGYSGYSALQDTTRDLNAISGEKLKSVYYIGNCRHAMRYMQGMMLIATGTDNLARVQSVAGKFDDGIKEMEENLEKVRPIVEKDQELSQSYAQIQQDWSIY